MKALPGVSYLETLRGVFTLNGPLEADGPSTSRCEVTARLRINIPEFDPARADSHLLGVIEGSIDFLPPTAAVPISAGRFHLSRVGGDRQTKTLNYAIEADLKGEPVLLTGYKEIREDSGFELWTDTTTVFCRLHRGRDRAAAVVGDGVLRLSATEFDRSLGSVKALNASTPEEADRVVDAFVRAIANGVGADRSPLRRMLGNDEPPSVVGTGEWVPAEIVRMKSWE